MYFTDKLQSIDLTGNQISEMDEDTFRFLPKIQELILAGNNLQVMPELPVTMKHIDLRNNRLSSWGVHSEGFKVNNLHTIQPKITILIIDTYLRKFLWTGSCILSAKGSRFSGRNRGFIDDCSTYCATVPP